MRIGLKLLKLIRQHTYKISNRTSLIKPGIQLDFLGGESSIFGEGWLE